MAVEKMTLQAFSDEKFSTKAGEAYTVFLNPETFANKSQNSYDKSQVPGGSGATPRFNFATQGDLAFSLILDGTRFVDGVAIEVSTHISKLKALALNYHGKDHSPHFVQVAWGKFLFRGRLTTFNVTYTMFRPDGTPLRAKVDLAFISFTDARALALKADNMSSDLSHTYLVKAGDTLPQLCYQIYGDSKYYLQVAQRNNLVHFSRLVPGTVLLFPPLRAVSPASLSSTSRA